jgi:hypothetical protein
MLISLTESGKSLPSVEERAVEEAETSVKHSSTPTIGTRPAKRASWSGHVTKWYGIGWFQSRSRVFPSSDDGVDEETETEWSFLPSVWLRMKGLTLSQNRTSGRWQYTFTPVCVKPDSARIFRACVHGDVEEVKGLIKKGEATIFDTSEKGFTLLHVSVKAS